ncbi:MAG: carboxypeptidase regulatory-like domain-containing protein [Anaerolineae bacterium]|nr:carboxypeptidase regulatory-like domain-containing protein [Anaerolineae bacterium]
MRENGRLARRLCGAIVLFCAMWAATAAAPTGRGVDLASGPATSDALGGGREAARGAPLLTALPGTVTLVPGTVALDAAIEQAVLRALEAAREILPRLDAYAPSHIRHDGEWAFVSLVGLGALQSSHDWQLEDAAWTGLVLLRRTGADVWEGAVEGTPAYAELLSALPETVVDEVGKQGLDPERRAAAAVSAYLFPWEAETWMYYGSLGVHEGGFIAGWKAVDFCSDGNVRAGRAPNRLLAAASGAISYVCKDDYSVAIRIGDLLYVHLLDNANLTVGRYVEPGEELGQLRTGYFYSNCGWAYQDPEWFHLHWGFPDREMFEAGGWTLDLGDGVWRKGVEKRGVGEWFRADPDEEAARYALQLHRDPDYLSGYCYADSPGGRPNLDGCAGYDDQVSSILLAPGWSVRVYEQADWRGTCRCLDASDTNLADDAFEDGSALDDRISSFVLYAQTGCPDPPAPPTLLGPVDGGAIPAGEHVLLSWSGTGDAYSGEVWGGPEGGRSFGWQPGSIANIGLQSEGQTYYWRVKARNDAGESPWSETWRFAISPALEVLEGLVLTPTAPLAGESVTATFRVRNAGVEALSLPRLGVSVRGPGCDAWACVESADYPWAEELVLQPGESYAYVGVRAFSVPDGAYLAWPHVQREGQDWQALGARTPFSVAPGLEIWRDLSLAPGAPLAGQVITAQYTVRNAGSRAIAVHRAGVAARGPGYASWACQEVVDWAARGIVLAAGEAYTYSEQRAFAQPISGYLAAAVYADLGLQWYTVPGAELVPFSVGQGGQIRGTARLQGGSDHAGIAVTAWLGETAVAAATTDAAGGYTLTVATGRYTVTVEAPYHLDGWVKDVVVPPGGASDVPFLLLPGGDATDDECIDIFDLSLVAARFGATPDEPDWDPRADAKRDGVIDILDLTVVGAHFGQCAGPFTARP